MSGLLVWHILKIHFRESIYWVLLFSSQQLQHTIKLSNITIQGAPLISKQSAKNITASESYERYIWKVSKACTVFIGLINGIIIDIGYYLSQKQLCFPPKCKDAWPHQDIQFHRIPIEHCSSEQYHWKRRIPKSHHCINVHKLHLLISSL